MKNYNLIIDEYDRILTKISGLSFENAKKLFKIKRNSNNSAFDIQTEHATFTIFNNSGAATLSNSVEIWSDGISTGIFNITEVKKL